MRSFLITDPVNDIILMTIVGIISIVTTIGGVGGGGLLIPLYMLFGGFLLEESIKIGIYKKDDFNKNPVEYCGTNITDTPLNE